MARVTLEQVRESRPTIDRAKMEATTEADIRRHQIEDGEDPDAEGCASAVFTPGKVRRQLDMTQAEFAAALRIPVKTIQNWEQGRTLPDPATRSLMNIVARAPFAALSALNPGDDGKWRTIAARAADGKERYDHMERDAATAAERAPADR